MPENEKSQRQSLIDAAASLMDDQGKFEVLVVEPLPGGVCLEIQCTMVPEGFEGEDTCGEQKER